jgi:hypothetical protein
MLLPFPFGNPPGSTPPDFQDLQRLYPDGSDPMTGWLAPFSGHFSNSGLDQPMVDSSHFNTLGLLSIPHWPNTSESKSNSQLLSFASHDALLSSQNHAYMQLHQHVIVLGKDYEMIQAKYATLE